MSGSIVSTLYSMRLFIALGAAYGTSKAGIGIAGIGPFKPELVMKVYTYITAPSTTYLYVYIIIIVAYSSCHEWYRRCVRLGGGCLVGWSKYVKSVRVCFKRLGC